MRRVLLIKGINDWILPLYFLCVLYLFLLLARLGKTKTRKDNKKKQALKSESDVDKGGEKTKVVILLLYMSSLILFIIFFTIVKGLDVLGRKFKISYFNYQYK